MPERQLIALSRRIKCDINKYLEQILEYEKELGITPGHTREELLKLNYNELKEIRNPLKSKLVKRSKVKKVDTNAIVEKIIAEGREKNKGKKVISFRDINKELRPYMIKKMKGVNAINKDTMSSIDIYLNAVDKIDVVEEATTKPEMDKPDLNSIIDDLDK
jgi:hypothetical protein